MCLWIRLYVGFLKGEFQFPIALFVPYMLCFVGLSLWCRSQRLGCPMWGTNTLLLQEELWTGEIPLYGIALQLGFLQDCVSAYPTHLDVFFLSFMVKRWFT